MLSLGNLVGTLLYSHCSFQPGPATVQAWPVATRLDSVALGAMCHCEILS